MTEAPSRSLFRAAGLVSLALVTSRLLGYLREALLAARFGATHTTDAYLVAQELPFILFSAISTALVMVFIPVYREQVERRGEREAWSFVNAVANATLLLAALLLVLAWLAAPGLIPFLVPGLPAEYQGLVVHLTRIMLPMMLFMAVGAVASAVLNANRRFTAPSLVGLANNVVVVAVLFAVAGPGQIDWVAWAVVGGALAAALIQLPDLFRLGFRFRPALHLAEPALRRLGLLILPVVFATGAAQVQTLIDRFLASNLSAGSISALSYANKVNALPYGVIGIAIVTVLFPSLAEQAAAGRLDDLRETVGRGLRMLAFLLLPMALGVILFAGPIVQVIFQRGAFDPEATATTAYALRFYATGILFFGWLDLLNRSFFSLQDTLTPMWIGLGMVGLNLAFNLALIGPLAHGGLALGTSLSTAVAVLILLRRLTRRVGPLGGADLLRSVGTSLATSLAGAAAGFLAYSLAERLLPGQGLLSLAVRLALGLGVLEVVHNGLGLWLGHQAAQDLFQRLKGRLRRRNPARPYGS